MDNTTNTNTVRVSYWIRSNRYAGKCAACGETVEAGKGWTQKNGEKWETLCGPCVKANANYLPECDRRGERKYVRALNDSHDGGDLFTCAICGREVVLVKSARSGKWFFCEVVSSEAGHRYAATHQPHSQESCDKRKTQNDALVAEARGEVANAEEIKAEVREAVITALMQNRGWTREQATALYDEKVGR